MFYLNCIFITLFVYANVLNASEDNLESEQEGIIADYMHKKYLSEPVLEPSETFMKSFESLSLLDKFGQVMNVREYFNLEDSGLYVPAILPIGDGIYLNDDKRNDLVPLKLKKNGNVLLEYGIRDPLIKRGDKKFKIYNERKYAARQYKQEVHKDSFVHAAVLSETLNGKADTRLFHLQYTGNSREIRSFWDLLMKFGLTRPVTITKETTLDSSDVKLRQSAQVTVIILKLSPNTEEDDIFRRYIDESWLSENKIRILEKEDFEGKSEGCKSTKFVFEKRLTESKLVFAVNFTQVVLDLTDLSSYETAIKQMMTAPGNVIFLEDVKEASQNLWQVEESVIAISCLLRSVIEEKERLNQIRSSDATGGIDVEKVAHLLGKVYMQIRMRSYFFGRDSFEMSLIIACKILKLDLLSVDIKENQVKDLIEQEKIRKPLFWKLNDYEADEDYSDSVEEIVSGLPSLLLPLEQQSFSLSTEISRETGSKRLCCIVS